MRSSLLMLWRNLQTSCARLIRSKALHDQRASASVGVLFTFSSLNCLPAWGWRKPLPMAVVFWF